MAPPDPETPESEVLRITVDELATVRVPPPAAVRPAPPDPGPSPQSGGSRLSATALILAVLGIPLPGLVLGPIAAVCGAIALSRDDREEKSGFGMAVAALCLGVVEFFGWAAVLTFLLLRPGPIRPGPAPLDLGSEVQLGTADAPPQIRRALRANVRVVCEGDGGGEGSGVVVRRAKDRVLLITNRHVVRCAETAGGGRIRVSDAEGHGDTATVRWLAPEGVDLAVLQSGPLAETEDVELRKRPARIGDPVFVVGNPLGLPGSVAMGTVSALRTSSAGSRSVRILQIQASVNPGNSGGGLYSADGTLLGVVTWMAEKRQGEGIGFAIAVDDVVDLMNARNDLWKEVSDR